MATHQFIPGVYTTSELLPYETEDNGDEIYTRYTDGKILKKMRPRVEYVDHKEIIIKKSIITDGESTTTRFEKTYDFWANRKTATYIPICRPFKEDGSTMW